MSGEVVLTQADGGREVPVAPGAEVVLRLPETPTTGFRWTPPEGVALTADRTLPGDAAPGAAGLREMRLRMPDHSLALRLRRRQEWQPDAPDALLDLRLVPR